MAFSSGFDNPERFISGPGDVPDEATPFEESFSSESMTFPGWGADSGSPTNNANQDIIENVMSCRRHSKEKTSRYDMKRRRAHDYVNNRYLEWEDNPDREDWQSDKVAPKAWTMVEQFSASISSMLERSDDWTGMRAVSSKKAPFLDFLKEKVQKEFRSNRTQFHRFFYKYVKSAVKNGFAHALVLYENDGVPTHTQGDTTPDESASGFAQALQSGGMGFLGDQENKPNLPGKGKPRLRLELVSHDNVTMDPETGGKMQEGGWKIFTQYQKKGYFRKQAEKLGYDMGAVDRALQSHNNSADYGGLGMEGIDFELEQDERDDLVHNMAETGHARIDHFYGTLYDSHTHEIVLDTKYFVVVNDCEIVLPPMDLPFWEGEDPLVSSPLIEDDHNKLEGDSPLLMALDMFQLSVELSQMMEDFYTQQLLGMKEIDLDLLDDFDEDFAEGFFPGKLIWTRKGQNPNASAVKIVPQAQTDAGFWNYFGQFKQESSAATLLPDATQGLPKTRGRTSNMEDARRATEGGVVMTSVFRSLEDNCLVPLARKSTYRMLQETSAEQWKTEVLEFAEHYTENVGPLTGKTKEWMESWEAAAEWTPKERWEKLAGDIEFEIRVFSTLGDRQRLIEQASYLLQTLTQVPGAMERIDMDEMMRFLIRGFDLSPSRILKLSPAQGEQPQQPGGPPQPGGEGGQEQDRLTGDAFQGMTNNLPTPPPGIAG